MKYVASHTSIPVLKVLGSGTCAVGPYMVMEFVEGKTLSGYLKNPSESTRLTILDPNVGTSTLRKAYHEMARIILALYQCKFPRIGSVSLHESGAWSVSDRRAVTWNMNELVSLGNYPPPPPRISLNIPFRLLLTILLRSRRNTCDISKPNATMQSLMKQTAERGL